jgi:hypothetical protein
MCCPSLLYGGYLVTLFFFSRDWIPFCTSSWLLALYQQKKNHAKTPEDAALHPQHKNKKKKKRPTDRKSKKKGVGAVLPLRPHSLRVRALRTPKKIALFNYSL